MWTWGWKLSKSPAVWRKPTAPGVTSVPALYDELAHMEEEGLRAELDAIVQRYFQVGLAELELE